MKLQNTKTIGVLAVLCCILWGSAFPCVKIGYAWFGIEGAGSQILFAGWRFFLAGVLTFLLFSMKDRRLLTIRRSSVPAVFGQGLLQTTVQYFFFYLGLANTTGTRGSVITASNVFFSIIIAHFFVKGEKITRRKILGCITGFAGVVLVNLSPDSLSGAVSWNGEGFVLLCAVTYGISNVTTRMLTEREKPEAVTAWQLMSGGLVLIAAGYAAGGSMGRFTPASAVLFFYLAMLSTVAFTVWAALLKYNPVGKVTPYGFTIPVFGTAFSGIFLHERIFTWNSLLALILVSTGIILVNSAPGTSGVQEKTGKGEGQWAEQR
ncbi:MAG: DMT family transporter [Emergencia sp.]